MYHTEIQQNFNLIPVVYIENCDTVLCTDHPWGLCVCAHLYMQSVECNNDYI